MPERYTKLYSVEPKLYAAESPVIIEAGALLKDNKTGGILGQLKILNISPKNIISLTVGLETFDISDSYLEDVEFTYMDLNVSRDEPFGAKTPIPLTNPVIRIIRPYVKKVVFSDRSSVELKKSKWKTLPGQIYLSYVLDPEYVAAYQDNFSLAAEYVPIFSEDLWLCACGKANKVAEKTCHFCSMSQETAKRKPESLKSHLTYKIALNLMKVGTKTAYAQALKLFEQVPDVNDAKEKAQFCQQKIDEITAKEEADRLEAERKAEEERIAAENARKMRRKKAKKFSAITLSTLCVCIAVTLLLTTVIIPSIKYKSAYNSAEELYNAKKYEDAYKAFNALSYKDSAEKASECLFLKQKAGLTNVSVGSTIKFGIYEQDNNTSNGKEEIEWKVLAVEGNKAFIISQYALDCKPYNNTYTDTTWEQCTLRTWLNETFFNDAFGADHQKMIVSSTVTADKNPSYGTSPGNNTTDKVFLLSITEVNKYFSSDGARKCASTYYAEAQGAYSNSYIGGRSACWWWLRSPGSSSDSAADVSIDGSVYNRGRSVNSSDDGVRPAMWIKTN